MTIALWKTVLFVSSRAFSLSTPVGNSEATWKKATKCNKHITMGPKAFWPLSLYPHNKIAFYCSPKTKFNI